ncbi:AP2 domain transcription factor AP2VIIa-9 [Cardiosporidium cionae]|uniref:AP2 domain transcription factor AP2VIIa-9 n=1 Tax=Cardiosporidium cionae TaxID=476202 RepID=A0ABQ7J3Q5_9APIC|nr:AP2 domain transcription factor AP2VIIa-9 [Cardiosporidium cionae]|eukprot:KAF8817727.1 AP2 domain transcription factor AP2VIIa-9 [Cardiosporidium cionae]
MDYNQKSSDVEGERSRGKKSYRYESPDSSPEAENSAADSDSSYSPSPMPPRARKEERPIEAFEEEQEAGSPSKYVHKQELRAQMLLKLELLPRVAGVCFDRNRQRWIAHWKVGGKYVKNYFPVSQYGFEAGRNVAIRCRRDAEKQLQLNNPAPAEPKVATPPSPAKSHYLPRASRQQTQRPVVGVTFDRRKQSWLASYTAYRSFPVSEFGYHSARKLAVEYRNSKTSRKGSKHDMEEEADNNYQPQFSDVSLVTLPLDSKAKKENNARSTHGTDFQLTHRAVQIILGDLKVACLSKLREFLPMNLLEFYVQLVDQHLATAFNASSIQQLRPYVTLFCHCILNKCLPSVLQANEVHNLLDSMSRLPKA